MARPSYVVPAATLFASRLQTVRGMRMPAVRDLIIRGAPRTALDRQILLMMRTFQDIRRVWHIRPHFRDLHIFSSSLDIPEGWNNLGRKLSPAQATCTLIIIVLGYLRVENERKRRDVHPLNMPCFSEK